MEMEDLFGQPVMSLRDQQKVRTHLQIVAAAAGLIREGGEGAVTMRAVAARTGVTERTVYRHFKSRDVLLEALRQLVSELVGPQPAPRTPGELVERPRSYFLRLEQQGGLVRAYLQSQSRRKGRKRSVDKERNERMIRCVQTEMQYLDKRKLRRRAAIADLIASPYALEWMQQFWGFSAKEAGEAAAEALDILINLGLAY